MLTDRAELCDAANRAPSGRRTGSITASLDSDHGRITAECPPRPPAATISTSPGRRVTRTRPSRPALWMLAAMPRGVTAAPSASLPLS
jgi:hypothetical protein